MPGPLKQPFSLTAQVGHMQANNTVKFYKYEVYVNSFLILKRLK